jgi:type IV secretion system protein VirB8
MRFPFKRQDPGEKQEPPAAKAKRIPQTFIQAAEDFETFKIDELKKSRKTAWMVAGISTVIAVIAVLGITIALITQPVPEPVVLKLDNATGDVTMLRSVRDHHDSFNEVVNKYWVGNFVRTCERYEWFSISTDFAACELFSAANVFREYANRVQASDAPINVLKDRGRIEIKVTSIVMLSPNNAQVRFTSQQLNAAGENPMNQPLQRWIATISFHYQTTRMTEQQRLINPLGFMVLSYRVDPETLGMRR